MCECVCVLSICVCVCVFMCVSVSVWVSIYGSLLVCVCITLGSDKRWNMAYLCHSVFAVDIYCGVAVDIYRAPYGHHICGSKYSGSKNNPLLQPVK